MSLLEEIAAASDVLLQPLAGAPAGVDVSLNEDFGKLRVEIEKPTSVSGGASDWAVVHQGASALLRTSTRDFRLASWLAVAEAHLFGFRGAATGMYVLSELVKRYWDTAFPDVRRLRGRANLHVWLTEQLNLALESAIVGASDGDAVRLFDQLHTELDAMLDEKLGENHPGPGRLRATIHRLLRSIPEPPPPPPPPPAPRPPPTTAASAPGPVSPAVSEPRDSPSPSEGIPAGPPAARAFTAADLESEGDIDDALGIMAESMGTLASALRQARPEQACTYRIHRAGLWFFLDEIVEPDDGRLDMRAPAAAGELEALAADSAWAPLIERCEEESNATFLWLDPHRFVAEALEAQGFTRARDEVSRSVLDLIDRIPKLLELSFSDGTPLASRETQDWIASERLRLRGTAGAADSGAQPGGGSPLSDALKTAEDLAAAGQLGDALAIAVRAAETSGNGRTRFRTLLRAGRLALDGGEPEVARAMLESLHAAVADHELEAWDPELCAELYVTLIQALRGNPSENVDLIAREGLLFEKLCRLDPRAALLLARR